ncbi:MAG TPA: enoyl-CoA hydratase/isomerase family protein [Ramlibacter sp.]|jgi:enoyl-CoA hydratase/carnithine racemase|nr:enoyl-CoA hydratase/isomerase family protein [Ramlibacter sp.]
MQQTYPEGLVAQRDGGVLTLTIDRSADQNRLSPDVVGRLEQLVDGLREDRDTNVVVITGSGSEVFSFGLLNPAIRAGMAKDDVVALVRRGNRLFDAIESLPQVVIAALNGAVVAGAAELALACDLRYAAANATMVMPEATWGGFPGAGAPVRLPQVVGRARALELICTGRRIDASEMEKLGIVLGVHAQHEFMPQVMQVARTIAASGPLAVRGAKRIVHVRQSPGFGAARELSDALRHALEWSADVDEGIAAHRENRKPRFSGR